MCLKILPGLWQLSQQKIETSENMWHNEYFYKNMTRHFVLKKWIKTFDFSHSQQLYSYLQTNLIWCLFEVSSRKHWKRFPPLVALRPIASQWSLILEVSRSHNLDAAQSGGLHWTKDQADTEKSIWHHNTQTTNCHVMARFENTISVGERPKSYALNLANSGTGNPRIFL